MSAQALASGAPDEKPLLSVDDIHTYYGDSHILQGLSFDVRAGECVALLGRNGAGKTTTLRSIVGLTPVRRGSVTFRDQAITRWPTHRSIGLGIGYVPEDRGIFSSLTVREHLEVAKWAGRKSAEQRDAVLETFPRLGERMEHYGQQLSGGEQQMLAMGRAMMSRPKLLMLDEPSMGLSPLMMKRIMSTVSTLQQRGTTILLVEQNAQAALKRATHGYVLEVGKIVLEGSGSELLASDDVRKAYLGED